jgi:hypothetical protein
VKCIKGIIVSATDGQHLLTGATRRRDWRKRRKWEIY